MLSAAAMCLFNSPIRGDTHVSEGNVGFSKTMVPNNVSDKPIHEKVEVSASNRQEYLPQTSERTDSLLRVMGMAGILVIVGYGVKKRRMMVEVR